MNAAIILGTMAFFGIAHSLTAGQSSKDWAQGKLGERVYHGTYRLLYNALTVLTLVPAVLAISLLPDQALYTVPLPWAAFLIVVQAAGAIGVILTLLMTGLSRFAGLQQVMALLNDDDLPLKSVAFTAGGPYQWVRHPLYLFSLLFLWASPMMTSNTLLFNLGATVYLLIGTFPEERKLVRLYGERYRDYQAQVPRLLPWPRPRGHQPGESGIGHAN